MPGKALARAGHEMVFATAEGAPPSCDRLLIDGVFFGQLGSEPDPKAFYEELLASAERNAPVRHEDFDAAWFAGGHAKGMRPYLDSGGGHS